MKTIKKEYRNENSLTEEKKILKQNLDKKNIILI